MAEDVIQICDKGYLKGNGDFVRFYDEKILFSNAEKVMEYKTSYSYVGKDGDTYMGVWDGTSYVYINIGKKKIKAWVGERNSETRVYDYFYLQDDGELYQYVEEGEDILVERGVVELRTNDEASSAID